MFASWDSTDAGTGMWPTDDDYYGTTGYTTNIRIPEFKIPEELLRVPPKNWRWFHLFYELDSRKFVAKYFRARQRAFRFLIMPSVLDNVRQKRRKRLQEVRS